MNEQKFYMQRYVGGRWEQAVDLESKFSMKYLSAKGLSDKGSIKNIYVEKYADSESLRVWFPETAVRDNTDIVLMFGFTGAKRRDNYDAFCEWVENKKVKYYDNVRNRETEMFLQKKIQPEKDYFVGDEPYMVVPFKFTNINGKTIKHK